MCRSSLALLRAVRVMVNRRAPRLWVAPGPMQYHSTQLLLWGFNPWLCEASMWPGSTKLEIPLSAQGYKHRGGWLHQS